MNFQDRNFTQKKKHQKNRKFRLTTDKIHTAKQQDPTTTQNVTVFKIIFFEIRTFFPSHTLLRLGLKRITKRYAKKQKRYSTVSFL